MYKILISRADIGGTIDNQKQVQAKVVSDLESQLNDDAVKAVLSVAAHETDHEFILIAAAEVADPPAAPAQGE